MNEFALPPLDLHSIGGSVNSIHPRRHLFIFRRLASPCRHLFICSAGASIAAPQSFQRAGKSHCRAAIISTGRRISLPRRILFRGPVNLIAAPTTTTTTISSFGRRIDCRATIISAGRRIPSPRHNLFSGRANPIATPQSFQRAGESHCRAAFFSEVR